MITAGGFSQKEDVPDRNRNTSLGFVFSSLKLVLIPIKPKRVYTAQVAALKAVVTLGLLYTSKSVVSHTFKGCSTFTCSEGGDIKKKGR